MEGKVGTDPRRLAYDEYMNSKDKARYVALAQKLAQHINHLAEDKNTGIRWIWELIQNAKDVPNQFGRCRIRIQIKDDKLIFAHNGDPFRVSDLQSLVAQYSSKAEQNKLSTQTTGKYGTGFIVTYILSKKIRIKGLLSMKTIQEQQISKKSEKNQEQETVQLSSEQQISSVKAKNIKKQYSSQMKNQQHSLQENANVEDDVQKMMPKKSKFKNFEGGSLYQRFDIFLDRQYKDRDKQLFYKLMMTERNLMEDLLKIEPEPKWQRKQGELNTQFIYQDIDQAANRMITESMACLKELFPYAMLFNPKLFQIQVIDKRTYKSIRKFGIKRLEEESFNGLKIFNANILEQGSEKPKKFSLAYIEDEDTYSTIAIPLEIGQKETRLLQMNNKLPKIFKEFPLIGCKDTGFNFAFTSKRFYPNQTRSNLLLQEIQGRDSKKTKANWQAVKSIFQKGLQLYKSVARIIDAGQENLFIVSTQNQFSHSNFKHKKMQQIYRMYQEEITQLKCISFRNKSLGTIQQLTFPFGQSDNKKVDHQKYGYNFNSVFSIVLGQESTLSDQNYKRFYPIFDAYSATWKEFTKFPDVKGCISQLSKLKFGEIVYRVKSQQAALATLEKIYEFLLQNHPKLLDLENGQKQVLRFVLTNNKQLKDIRQNLAIKKDLPPYYEEIGLHLGIKIKQFTIFDRFTKYFGSIKRFGVPEMLQRFENLFFYNNNINSEHSLWMLGRFLTTFNIQTEAIGLATKLKQFETINQPFEINEKKNIQINDNKVKNQFRILFQLKILHYINKLMQENQRLSKLKLLLLPQLAADAKVIQWLNNIYKFQALIMKQSKSSEFIKAYPTLSQAKNNNNNFNLFNPPKKNPNPPTCLLQTGLSLSMNFVSIYSLKSFCVIRDEKYYKGNYPDKTDIQFYGKMKDIYNRRLPYYQNELKKQQLGDHIMHESIEHKQVKATTFQQQYKFIIGLYNHTDINYAHISTNSKEKIQILNYIFHLRQSAVKNRELQFKIYIFKDLEKKAYYQYPALTNSIQRPENQIFTFSLVKNQQQLTAARQIREEFGSLNKALEELRSLKAKKQGDTDKK